VRRERRVFAILLMAPTVAWTLIVLVYPIAITLRNSVHRVGTGFEPHPAFIGFANYTALVQDPVFWKAVLVTVEFTVGNLVGSFGFGLLSALLLQHRFWGRPVARAILLLPWAMPQVAAVVIWRWLLDTQYGAANFVLWRLHLSPTASIPWLSKPSLALYAVLIATVWWQYPIATTFLQAGIQSVSLDLYEAAAIDGANAWQKFRNVTWPGLGPVRNILLLMLLFWSLGQVIIIWAMTGMGPARATQTLAILVYTRAFNDFDCGSASALATIVLVFSLTIGLLYYRLLMRDEQVV